MAADPAPSDTDPGRLAADLRALSEAIRVPALSLDLADAERARTTRDELADQIDSYLLPRLANLDAPLLVVLGGSTGSGKSTLTNALVGREVTQSGVLRPTTRRPVLACHPDDEAWFANRNDGTGAVLPGLARTTGPAEANIAGDGLFLATDPSLPRGVGILDSPDIDSVEIANHDLAALLLGAADLWLFVTTAVRYADAVPWDYLRRAAHRSVALAVVVNRVPPGAETEISTDLADRLASEGLGESILFTINEGDLAAGVEPIRSWLVDVAGSAGERQRVLRQTIDGLVGSIPSRVDVVADAVDAEAEARRALDDLAGSVWARAVADVDDGIDDGVRLHDEVLHRFGEHVGSSELMGRLQTGIGRIRDRVGAALRGRPTPANEVQRAVGDSLEDLIVRVADRSALAVTDAWSSMPGGRAVLAGAPGNLARADPQLRLQAARAVERWQEAVLARIVDTAGSKVALARSLSLGINGVAAALMLGVFSQTGGLTGGEAVIAGGAAAASQTVLSAVFGDQVVRDLVRWARRDLLERVQVLYDTEAARYQRATAHLPDRDAAAAVRSSGPRS